MTSKQMSPAAKLLRSSRLFSIPSPLARLGSDYANAPSGSSTSTPPFPLHQAVATPATSQARGDWGFKRSLPLRSTTRSSTPSYRIKSIDTIEHVTDFESSGDVTQSLEKFAQLNLSISAHQAGMPKNQPKSVFEDNLDNTDPSVRDMEGKKRWRHRGPWLAGMSENDFDSYVIRQIRGRSQAFTAFLRRDYMEKRLIELQREDLAAGRPMRESFIPSAGDFEEHIQSLRSNFSTDNGRDRLAPLIRQFLDLPETESGESVHDRAQSLNDRRNPPTTHPSAGLSYLRSDAIMSNHPLFGPQARASPVESRIIAAGNDPNAISRRPLAGIGGFVTLLPDNKTQHRQPVHQSLSAPENELRDYERRDQLGVKIGVTMEGGAKVWLDPLSATVDSQGRATVDVTDSGSIAVSVKTGQIDGPPKHSGPISFNSRSTPRNLMNNLVDEPASSGRLHYQLDGSASSRGQTQSSTSSSSGSLLESLKAHRDQYRKR